MTFEHCLAYLDPGAGSILIQLLAAGLVGITVSFRRSVFGLFRFFRRSSG